MTELATDNASLEGDDYAAGSAALPDEPKEFFEGDTAIDQAVEALQTKRDAQSRQRPRLEDEDEVDANVTKVVWKDPEKANKPLSTRDAAREYSHYRQELANQILEGAQSEFDAARAAESQPVETEQQQTETEETPDTRWAQYYESLPPEGKAQINSAIELQQKSAVADEWANSYVLALNDLLGRLNGQTAEHSTTFAGRKMWLG
jgi:hypothetical protein